MSNTTKNSDLENVLNSLEGTIYEDLAKSFRAFLISMAMASQPLLQNEFLKTQQSFMELIKKFNRDINLKRDGKMIKCNFNPMFNFQGIMMGIIVFEILNNSKFNKIINRSEIFKFAKHIRNGCAHNNKFSFEKPLNNPVIWNKHKIDNSLEGKEVVPSFLWTGEMLLLARDIIREINNIKKIKST